MRREELAEVYRLYEAPMRRLALRILGEEHDAEDAVHDAFESVARNLERLAAPDDPRTRGYVMVIAERKAIDMLRTRKKIETAQLDEDAVGVGFPDTGARDLAWCMAQLPARYREILLLRFVYGYSMRETAALMELSTAAVGKLSQRAKERLYAVCRGEGLL